MAPPPSQAGKFKPRKPARAKKNRAGAAASPAGNASANAEGDQAAATGSVGASSGHNRGGKGRGVGRGSARGRGGRGRGRGRGRVERAVPQGLAFFTATKAPSTGTKTGASNLSSRKAKAAAAALDDSAGGRGAIRKTEDAPQEQIVGTLEEEIGSTDATNGILDQSKGNDRSNEKMEIDRILDGEDGLSNKQLLQSSPPLYEGYQYDSDSSREEGKEKPIQQMGESSLKPLALPFPSPKVPLGIGGSGVPPSPYPVSSQGSNKEEDAPVPPVTSSAALHQTGSVAKPTVPIEAFSSSPFMDCEDQNALNFENKSWFLVQFPTRLPPIRQLHDEKAANNIDGMDVDLVGSGNISVKKQTIAAAAYPETAEVATAPVKASSFDNKLASALPGRLGKMVVYKSGKTALVMNDPSGKGKVRPCSFTHTTNMQCVLSVYSLVGLAHRLLYSEYRYKLVTTKLLV